MFIDETHSSLRPIISRTWAGVGCTPMVKVSGKRDGVTIIGGLTEAGRIIALQTQDSMNCLGFIEFLKHALNEVTGKLVSSRITIGCIKRRWYSSSSRIMKSV